MKKQQIGWLPANIKQEETTSACILEYAFKPTSFSLEALSSSINIAVSDMEDFVKNKINGLLPDAFIAAYWLIKDRQDSVDTFYEITAKNKEGDVLYKEVHIPQGEKGWLILRDN